MTAVKVCCYSWLHGAGGIRATGAISHFLRGLLPRPSSKASALASRETEVAEAQIAGKGDLVTSVPCSCLG